MKRRLTYATFLFRRTILVVLVLILMAHHIQNWTCDKDRGMDDTIQALQADGPVTKITVRKCFPIDRDTFTADFVYVTPKQIVVTYAFRAEQKKSVWSFPTMSLKLVTPDGQQLLSHQAGSSGTTWGRPVLFLSTCRIRRRFAPRLSTTSTTDTAKSRYRS